MSTRQPIGFSRMPARISRSAICSGSRRHNTTTVWSSASSRAPAAGLNAQAMEGITASGPPLPVLLRSLEMLRDLRLAADRSDIVTRHDDLDRLRSVVHGYRPP